MNITHERAATQMDRREPSDYPEFYEEPGWDDLIPDEEQE
jgi:hypothetical protein